MIEFPFDYLLLCQKYISSSISRVADYTLFFQSFAIQDIYSICEMGVGSRYCGYTEILAILKADSPFSMHIISYWCISCKSKKSGNVRLSVK